ncbi:MAG TPA: sulfotransferase [Lacipirellulaceae bacterium]|nr:sulfotransferase [Lacipirellulaceae bacterium]
MSIGKSESHIDDGQSLRMFTRKIKRHPVYRVVKRPFDLMRDLPSSAWRMMTNRVRHLPTSVIVGAQKAGTTQLYAHLVKHPRCFGAAEKEVCYFSWHADRSLSWYRSRFPWRRRVWRRQGQVLEASPSYLPNPGALRMMQRVLPSARIIVLLRDPVERSFSHYQHEKTRHREARTFEEAVEEEIRANIIPPELGVALRDDAQPMLGYVSRGYYALQLELLLKLYRRNRVLVIDSASLFADTTSVCERVFSYMGLESYDVDPGKVYNRGFYREAIDPGVAERLREHYRAYDALLAEVLGWQPGWTVPRAQAA